MYNLSLTKASDYKWVTIEEPDKTTGKPQITNQGLREGKSHYDVVLGYTDPCFLVEAFSERAYFRGSTLRGYPYVMPIKLEDFSSKLYDGYYGSLPTAEPSYVHSDRRYVSSIENIISQPTRIAHGLEVWLDIFSGNRPPFAMGRLNALSSFRRGQPLLLENISRLYSELQQIKYMFEDERGMYHNDATYETTQEAKRVVNNYAIGWWFEWIMPDGTYQGRFTYATPWDNLVVREDSDSKWLAYELTISYSKEAYAVYLYGSRIESGTGDMYELVETTRKLHKKDYFYCLGPICNSLETTATKIKKVWAFGRASYTHYSVSYQYVHGQDPENEQYDWKYYNEPFLFPVEAEYLGQNEYHQMIYKVNCTAEYILEQALLCFRDKKPTPQSVGEQVQMPSEPNPRDQHASGFYNNYSYVREHMEISPTVSFYFIIEPEFHARILEE